tara:strand:+ start:68 stop:1030 length:963 start_codon:yes stop_codon:yes gene_type:complete
MKIKLLRSNNNKEILHEAYIYLSEYYLEIAEKQKLDFSNCGKLGLQGQGHWIKDVCEQNIQSAMLEVHLMLCDFNKPEGVIQDELYNFDIIKNTHKISHILDIRYGHLNRVLNDIKNKRLGKNLLTQFSEGSCWICRWDNNKDLTKIIEDTIEEYDPLDFFSEEKKYMPEKMLDAKSLDLLNDLNIPLRSILVERHNEEYLGDDWWVQYQITIDVSDDFEENWDNVDHIAYEVLDILGVSVDGNVLTYVAEEENLCDGYDISPLSKNINELIEEKVKERFENNLSQEYFNGEIFPELIAENGYSLKIIKTFFEGTDNLLK